MTNSLEEIDYLLARATPVDESIPAATLRRWRTDLVRASVFVSYAISVLSLDLGILNRSLESPGEDVLQSLVDDLPGLLASEWVGGGWSLSPDASVSVAAAAELAMDQSGRLLALHAEIVASDLANYDEVRALLERVEQQRAALTKRRDQLETRIRNIQETVLRQYATGAASVDDWLT